MREEKRTTSSRQGVSKIKGNDPLKIYFGAAERERKDLAHYAVMLIRSSLPFLSRITRRAKEPDEGYRPRASLAKCSSG